MENTAPYNIKPEPCTENGVRFDSKLERRVARFLTSCGFEWKREPQHFETWLPDFLVTIDSVEYFIEVKPSYQHFDLSKCNIALKQNKNIILIPESPLHAVTFVWKDSCKAFRDCLPENAYYLWAETI